MFAMRAFDVSFLASIILLVAPLAHGAKPLRGFGRSLQSDVIRTDLIRLIPFQVQMAFRDEASEADSQVIAETLYRGGSLLTDTITDWMMASFVTKTSNDQAQQLIQNNYTSFDSIALEMVDDSSSTGTIDGQELSLVQVSYEGVTLWGRIGTGTPAMEPEIVELIQRATFLEDRSLKLSLQNAVNNLLFDLNIASADGVQPITIVEVRAYIVPPSSIGGEGEDDQDEEAGEGSTESTEETDTAPSTENKNLETIIIVAIVVACLAFALLVFAVVWAWRSDRRDRNGKPMYTRNKKAKKTKVPKSPKPETKKKKKAPPNRKGGALAYEQAPAEPSIEGGSSYDLPRNDTDNSYPKEIGKSGNDSSAYPEDSVLSEDISSSLTAYYKSGMGYNGSKASSAAGSREPRNFNDAASMSSMDSYGYSLDGYAPSLGPAQGGYPVGLMQAARDAPMPIGDSDTADMKQLQDDESVDDYA